MGRPSRQPFAMDPRKLVYFASVVEQGSFNKAARSLGISQPALSLSMDVLEREVGAPLFARGPGGVTPTSTAEMLYHHARAVRDELRLAQQQLSRGIEQTDNSIRFGCLPSLAGSVIPCAISSWRDRNRGHNLRIFERVQIDLLSGLLRREFDFTIGVTDFYDLLDGLMQRVLYRERLGIVARPGHPLRSKGAVNLADLTRFPWISPPAGRHNTLLEDVLAAAGLSFREQKTVCSSATLLKSLVEGSDHLALLPAHAIQREVDAERLSLLPVQLPELDRSIAVFFREGFELNGASEDLVREIQRAGQAINQTDPAI